MRPGLCSGEGDIAIPQHDRAYLVHQQINNKCARQEDGEEIHQADENFLAVEVHGYPRNCSPVELRCLQECMLVVGALLLMHARRSCSIPMLLLFQYLYRQQ